MQMSVSSLGLSQLANQLEAARKDEKKSLATAIKVEGFRLRAALKEDLSRGAPGGRPLAALSQIARKLKRSSVPLKSLSRGVGYQYLPEGAIAVGFVGPRVSKSWKRIAEKMQEGGTREPSPEQRRYFAIVGGRMGKRSQAKKFFFLRAQTSELTTPARPIIKPFWEANKAEAARNIAKNWQRKLKGERI